MLRVCYSLVFKKRTLVLAFINCICQLVAQELDDSRIHVLNAQEILPTLEVGVLSLCLTAIERVLGYIRGV